jgi:hypothetical protein
MFFKIFLYLADFYHKKKITNFLKFINTRFNIIYDIGCHDCSYVKIFHKFYNNSKIFAFEANPNLIKIAKNNIKNLHNINLIQTGVGNLNKYKNFNINNNDFTSSFQNLNKKSKLFQIKKIMGHENNSKINIKIITLDNFISKNVCPDFIKVDVEGYEHEVLLGLKKNLKKIKLLMIEFRLDNLYLNYKKEKIQKLLTKNNFVLINKIKFPFLQFEDRFYFNKRFKNEINMLVDFDYRISF